MGNWGFHNTYAQLPATFYAKVHPTPVSAPRLLALNEALAAKLGLDVAMLRSPDGVSVLAGNAMPDDAEPIALAYAGHQFGSFAGRLGDGRAILLGELKGYDVQLKGAGPTPYSRRGDGRAAIGPVLREYVVSEAMAALGVPTTRSLAAVLTGDLVHRHESLPGAVLTRVAASHVRIGTFEWFASHDDDDAVQRLTAYCLARHYPTAEPTALALLENVIAAQAALVAQWLSIGFVHGVMNTDNMTISGETIDYGPCAFLDEYNPAKTFSSIDANGRYAYANQPSIAFWNLTRLAEALLPLIDSDEKRAAALATTALQQFAPQFQSAYLRRFRAKLGLTSEEAGDADLLSELLGVLAANEVDFTVLFRTLSHDGDLPAPLAAWCERWQARSAREDNTAADRQALMLRTNPAFIPRNHRIEELIVDAVERDDLTLFHKMNRALATPFTDDAASDLAQAPRLEQRVEATFCGT